MVVVKKDGRLEKFDSTKLIKSIGAKYKPTEALHIISQIEKELNTRFKEFYPNTNNIQDMVEKYALLSKIEAK
jgi:transcriptional regulator NrdR family protein